jgi:hypothetical protein
MTELGLCTIARQDLLQIVQAQNFGEHGENVLRAAKFLFFRMLQKSHLQPTNTQSRGAEGNHFGEARFITFNGMRKVLNELLNQDIPGMPGCKKPIIILGHAMQGDLSNINQGKDIAFNISGLDTVVKYLDTQSLVRETKDWPSTEGPRLEYLVAKLELFHSDPHTACNDAARTLMSAINLITRSIPGVHQGCTRSMEQVADDLEAFSVTNFRPFGFGNGYGSGMYCWRCGMRTHRVQDCTATTQRCGECVSRGLLNRAGGHIALHCPVVAEEEGEERRVWFAGQAKVAGRPKVPFVSRLTSYRPGAQAVAASAEEIRDRRAWYDAQTNPNVARKPWVWWKRSFASYQTVMRQGDPC